MSAENQNTRSPLVVQQLFRSLLCNTTPPPSSSTNTASATRALTSPPRKNTIRLIEGDQNGHREKYDGCRWRFVCTWNTNECKNIAGARQLCAKHNAIQRNKMPRRKRKPLVIHMSLPAMNYNNAPDDDIEILEEFCVNPPMRHSLNSNVKADAMDFKMFSVDCLNEHDAFKNSISEPKISSNNSAYTKNDVEFISSKVRPNGLNVDELISKNIPPLTEFEEECIETRIMEKLPKNCMMIDAQIFLHNEVIRVVKQNYRLKMDTVAPEFFYDFLLRHPRVALYFNQWFARCKPMPPTTGCSIDTKMWTLAMTVRGAMASNDIIDEVEE